MFEQIKSIFNRLINKHDDYDDESSKYPFSVLIEGIQYYAEKYILLVDADWRVCGVRWGTANHGGREYHGNGFMIIFNPLFKLEPPEIESIESYYHG